MYQNGSLSLNSQDPQLKIKPRFPPQTLCSLLPVFCRLMSAAQGEQTHPFGQRKHKLRDEREKMKKALTVCRKWRMFIYLFIMSSLTKNGIDHSHRDVQRGRYVGAECSIFIWWCHLQTKQTIRGRCSSTGSQLLSRNLNCFSPVRKWEIKELESVNNLVGNHSLDPHNKI